MLKKFGALPFIAIALLAGAFMAGRHSAPPAGPPGETTPAKPIGSGLLGSLFQSAGSNNTQAQIWISGATYDHDMTMGDCLYCTTALAITGDKGSDQIRCPNCGGTMPALKAILYFNYRMRRMQ